MSRTRILVADSLGIFRSGVKALLDRESDFEFVSVGERSRRLPTRSDSI